MKSTHILLVYLSTKHTKLCSDFNVCLLLSRIPQTSAKPRLCIIYALHLKKDPEPFSLMANGV